MAGHSDRGRRGARYFDDPGQRGKKALQAGQSRTGKNSCHREGERPMGETPDQIERHIYEKRNELGENIHELQQKVKTAVDWRAQFDRRPMTMMGLAFGGGLLLSMLFRGGHTSHRSSRRSSRDRERRESQPSEQLSKPKAQEWEKKASTTWGDIRAAVLAVAGSRLGSLMEG